MKTSLALFALLLLSCPVRASDSSPPFPLLGRWRVVERMGEDGHFHKLDSNKLLEYTFRPGRWEFRAGTLPDDIGSGDGSCTYQPPDKCIIIKNYGDSPGPTLTVQFHFEGKYAILKIQRSPDSRPSNDPSGGILKLRRIDPKD